MSTNYSPGNWAHKALLLMDEAESLIRWGSVSASIERYTPAAKAFWDVCHLLARERERIQAGNSGVAAAVSAMTDEQRMELFSAYCKHCGCANPHCPCENDE